MNFVEDEIDFNELTEKLFVNKQNGKTMMLDKITENQTKKIALKKIKLSMSHYLGAFGLSNSTINIMDEAYTNNVVASFHTYLFGQEKFKTYHRTVEIPATWWQMLKQDHFPAFLIDWFPVKTIKKKFYFSFDHTVLFPNINHIPKEPEWEYIIKHKLINNKENDDD
jgi:6-pyruvoyl-tetrahydropterin synthase